jgi:hypothetical protein
VPSSEPWSFLRERASQCQEWGPEYKGKPFSMAPLSPVDPHPVPQPQGLLAGLLVHCRTGEVKPGSGPGPSPRGDLEPIPRRISTVSASLRLAALLAGNHPLAGRHRSRARRGQEETLHVDVQASCDQPAAHVEIHPASPSCVQSVACATDATGSVGGYWVQSSGAARPGSREKSASEVTSVAPRMMAVAAIHRSFSSRGVPACSAPRFSLAYASAAAAVTGSHGIAAKRLLAFVSRSVRRFPAASRSIP